MPYLLTTDPGIEDLTVEELRELQPGARAILDAYPAPGRLRVEVDDGRDLLGLRTIYHVVEIRGESWASSLDDVRSAVRELPLPELSRAASFRVTSERSGTQPFGHVEIQRAAGAVLHERHGTPVDLEGYELNVRVDLYGDRLVAGVQRTRHSLDRRILRARALRTSIRPTLAAALLRLAGAHRGPGKLIDPCCGTGTIPVEAKGINPTLDVWACDWDPATVAVARQTIANHGLDIEVRPCDARSLQSTFAEPFDWIVSDPPYGLRVGRRASLRLLYEGFLRSFERVLTTDGRIVLVLVKFRTFLRALEPLPLEIVHKRAIDTGQLRRWIVVLRRSA